MTTHAYHLWQFPTLAYGKTAATRCGARVPTEQIDREVASCPDCRQSVLAELEGDRLAFESLLNEYGDEQAREPLARINASLQRWGASR